MKILVTGATGFIGRDLVHALVKKKHTVRALVRDPSVASFDKGVEVVKGDVTDPVSINKAMKGIDAIYHSAAMVRYDVPQAELDYVNVEGTRFVLNSAARNKVKRFILVSSVAAGGPGTTPYSISKKKAERVAIRYLDKFSLMIVRPAPVYGEGKSYIPKMINMAKKGKLYRFNVDPKTHIVDKSKVIEALVLALKKGESGVPYTIADEKPVHMSKLVNVIAKETGAKVQVLPYKILYPVIWGFGALFESLKVLGIKPPFTRNLLKVITRERKYSNELAIKDLGYTPLKTEVGLKALVKRMLK